ncbi:MAG: acetyl-CoA carboxylase biotin carboxylase subunit [Deltaproteobacteria bacterium]|nr:acetyl-CoA carboxylase biotin carboxylase subunit [Deltaproteobacteria bacterium]
MIKKILIANRGEIAVRVMRTCREMGIKTVAVFSEADRKSLFVRAAAEACCIGPAPSTESYLCIDKIIAVAKKTKACAIHPGYGFLSEKEAFSQACQDNGIVFLGPSPKAIALMGDKVKARECAQKAGVPMVPGTIEPLSDLNEIKKRAREFGYPVLLKAAAGGGGKGMRVVRDEQDIASLFAQARGEAEKSFGDGRIYLEKYVSNPRHVEIQLICDQHGHGVALLERECSMQRRHQKVIEEAPCVYLRDDVREKMMQAAVSLALNIGYTGAGTVEFLVDQNQNYYFLEMNTRLQVEHCVTEQITGIDLVRLQIMIGNGEKIPYRQTDITARGHAIECRIYAEDPANGFMPSPGVIRGMTVPEGPGIRHDTGVGAGSEISIYYDPMIAKLIVHAGDRSQAIEKMLTALGDYRILGLKNNMGFLKTLLNTQTFRDAQMHTQFIDQNPALTQQTETELPLDVILGAAAFKIMGEGACIKNQSGSDKRSGWWQGGGCG